MAKIDFQYEDLNLKSAIPEFRSKVHAALEKTIGYHATQGVKALKQNAPWTDRTANARAGLHTIPSSSPGGHYEIVFSHTVHYGIWLEIANSGRYQIIMPTVRSEGDQLMQRLRGLFGKLGALE